MTGRYDEFEAQVIRCMFLRGELLTMFGEAVQRDFRSLFDVEHSEEAIRAWVLEHSELFFGPKPQLQQSGKPGAPPFRASDAPYAFVKRPDVPLMRRAYKAWVLLKLHDDDLPEWRRYLLVQADVGEAALRRAELLSRRGLEKMHSRLLDEAASIINWWDQGDD